MQATAGGLVRGGFMADMRPPRLSGSVDRQRGMDCKDQLLAMIDRLVSGEWSVPEFEKQYYFFCLIQVPDDALPDDRDFAFFAMVQEKLDWTNAAPDAESRWLCHSRDRTPRSSQRAVNPPQLRVREKITDTKGCLCDT